MELYTIVGELVPNAGCVEAVTQILDQYCFEWKQEGNRIVMRHCCFSQDNDPVDDLLFDLSSCVEKGKIRVEVDSSDAPCVYEFASDDIREQGYVNYTPGKVLNYFEGEESKLVDELPQTVIDEVLKRYGKEKD